VICLEEEQLSLEGAEKGRCTIIHSPDKSLMVISAGAAIVRYWVLFIRRVRVIAIEVDAWLPNQVLCQKV
jgi:hypothetical protein